MMNFTETKDMTATTIKNEIKAQIIKDITEALSNLYGEENVRMVRIVSSTSKKNELGVRAAIVDVNGDEVPASVTISVTSKPYTDSPASAKRKYTAFNFDAVAAEYEDYIEEKEVKELEKARLKEDKIARDKKTRAKKVQSKEDNNE